MQKKHKRIVWLTIAASALILMGTIYVSWQRALQPLREARRIIESQYGADIDYLESTMKKVSPSELNVAERVQLHEKLRSRFDQSAVFSVSWSRNPGGGQLIKPRPHRYAGCTIHWSILSVSEEEKNNLLRPAWCFHSSGELELYLYKGKVPSAPEKRYYTIVFRREAIDGASRP